MEEAIQALEQAALLLRTLNLAGGSCLRLTRLGQRAIAEGDIARYLNTAGR